MSQNRVSSHFTGLRKRGVYVSSMMQDKRWGNWSIPAAPQDRSLGLFSLLLPETYEIIFDFSIYQSDYGYVGCTYNSKVNWKNLKDNGVKFVIFRVGGPGWTDASFAKHVSAAKEVGIICGFYFWVDPIRTPNTNVNGLKAHIDRWKPFFIALDIEQSWKSWSDFDLFLAGKITFDNLPKLTHAQVGNTVTALFDYIKTLNNIKSVAYSGWWYGSSSGLYPEVGDLITKYNMDYWNAHYLIKPISPNRSVKLAQLNDVFPLIPAWSKQLGCVSSEKTSLWQISSQILLAGQIANYDMNVLKPGLNLYNWLGLEEETTTPIPSTAYIPIVSV